MFRFSATLKRGQLSSMQTIDAWQAALVLVKALVYLATLAGAGGVLFASYSHDLLSRADVGVLRRWLWALAVIAAAASGLNILLRTAALGGEIGGMFDASLARMVWNAGEARATVLRLVGLALMSAGPVDTPRLRTSQLAGVILASTSFAWIGHTHAAAETSLPIAALAIHLLCVAFWVGALVPLLWMARGSDALRMAAAASRFSAGASFVVGLLVVAGSYLLWSLLERVTDSWTTAYGRDAMVKLGMVVCLLSLAALNRWRLTPRLRANQANALRVLRWSIRVEIVIAVCIFMATAVMTTLTGPVHQH
jgi:putative copper export protein